MNDVSAVALSENFPLRIRTEKFFTNRFGIFHNRRARVIGKPKCRLLGVITRISLRAAGPSLIDENESLFFPIDSFLQVFIAAMARSCRSPIVKNDRSRSRVSLDVVIVGDLN